MSASVGRLVDELRGDRGADWREVEQARFVINALTSALAPTNTLPGNPAALKRALDTGGRSVVRGLGNMLHDLRHNGGLPTQVDRTAFTVGTDLAVTPGAVVHRDEVCELIQYTPTHRTVRQRPLLIIPPQIGRYYFLDLRPGRSFVEYAVGQGLQVFMISWRNPAAEQADWDLDTYAGRVVDADRRRRGTSPARPTSTPWASAPGGILMTTVLNHLAANGDDRVHSARFAVTLLDFHNRAPIGAFSAPRLLDARPAQLPPRGRHHRAADGRGLHLDAPRRPGLQLLGQPLAHGQGPAGVRHPRLERRRHEPARRGCTSSSWTSSRTTPSSGPGAMRVLGTPVAPERITVPTFVTGALTDHLTPWDGCYRTTQLLVRADTFVLSNAGHIQSLVNPPGNPKASYWTGREPGPDPQAWRDSAERHTGSWWEAWSEWMLQRSGDEVPAPADGRLTRPPGARAGARLLRPRPGRRLTGAGDPARAGQTMSIRSSTRTA